jgi:hypothetical protein
VSPRRRLLVILSLSKDELDGFFELLRTGNFERDRARIARRLDVAFTIAHDDAAGWIDSERARGIKNELRLRFAAFAGIFGRVRADEESLERPEQFLNAPVDGVDLLSGNKTPANAALIAYDRERQTRRAQAIEQHARVRRRLDAIRIAVEGHVDDDRLVPIEEYCANM